MISIQFYNITGATFAIALHKDTSIKIIKDTLKDHFKLAFGEELKLLHHGHELSDDSTLVQSNVQNEAEIIIIPIRNNSHRINSSSSMSWKCLSPPARSVQVLLSSCPNPPLAAHSYSVYGPKDALNSSTINENNDKHTQIYESLKNDIFMENSQSQTRKRARIEDFDETSLRQTAHRISQVPSPSVMLRKTDPYGRMNIPNAVKDQIAASFEPSLLSAEEEAEMQSIGLNNLGLSPKQKLRFSQHTLQSQQTQQASLSIQPQITSNSLLSQLQKDIDTLLKTKSNSPIHTADNRAFFSSQETLPNQFHTIQQRNTSIPLTDPSIERVQLNSIEQQIQNFVQKK